jgi:adenylate cyclase
VSTSLLQLIASAPDSTQRLRAALEAGATYELGRDVDADFSTPWDPHISRRHVRLRAAGDHVDVRKLPEAANPVYFDGQRVESCSVRPGEHFVVGTTAFYVLSADADLSSPSAQPVEEVTFEPQELRKVRFRDADNRIEVLSHLPEVIWGARTDSELYRRLINIILAGVGHAEAAAIVQTSEDETVRVLHWDRRRETAGAFRPSGRLIHDAVGKRQRSVLHVWQKNRPSEDDYTAVSEFDWAFCTPIPDPAGEPWGLYVAGRLNRHYPLGHTADSEGGYLHADVKFTELVAEIISTVQRLNRFERRQSSYRQFFAPPVLKLLGDDVDADMLEPRECEVTVLFCDLRGFSQKAEEHANDLIGLLDRVSRALEVMTRHILKYEGVTGDFQGDAALGFWGWPFASNDAPLNACRAALGIRAAFEKTRDKTDHPLSDFQMGIGIALGRAVAGKIGTNEQVKITVFGPVVNLASRLESMTKQLRAPILLDEATAELVRRRLSPAEGRIRRLAKVQPYGIDKPLVVSELLPPESEFPELTDEHLRRYETGVEHFIAGRWEDAYRSLHQMPAGDRAQDFLGMLIAQHNRVAPPGWDGVVRLPNK